VVPEAPVAGRLGGAAGAARAVRRVTS
jgi:hypothetical protein